jgi:hypothetical protein
LPLLPQLPAALAASGSGSALPDRVPPLQAVTDICASLRLNQASRPANGRSVGPRLPQRRRRRQQSDRKKRC